MKNTDKKKKRVNVFNLMVCVVFFAMLLTFSVATVVLPKESFSDIENKSLQSWPKFSAKNLFIGDFTDKVETYISDHFAGRVSWISLKSKFEYALGKREQKGIYILNNRLIEKVGEPDYTEIDRSIESINKFAADNPDTAVYMMLVPTSAEFYKNEIPAYNPNLDQKEFIDYVYGGLENSIVPIDVYSSLKANANDYIYYRTDHHWTSKGAYLAYKAAGTQMGYTPLDESQYDIEHASSSFKGTFYSKTLFDGVEDDVIDYYYPNVADRNVTMEIITDVTAEPARYDSMYMREYLDVKDKYASFLGPNSPIVKLKSNNPDGRKLLVIKDSYAHCYAPFLTANYSEVTLLDLRYIQISYKQVVDVSKYDQVLFMYNVSSFSTDSNIKKLSY